MTNDRETGNGTPKADNAETSWGNGVMIAVTNTQMQGPDPPVVQTDTQSGRKSDNASNEQGVKRHQSPTLLVPLAPARSEHCVAMPVVTVDPKRSLLTAVETMG